MVWEYNYRPMNFVDFFDGFHVGKYPVRPMDPSWDMSRTWGNYGVP